jgi:hypothetical protein
MPNNGIVKFYAVNSMHDSIAVTDTIGKRLTAGTWTNLLLTKIDSLNKAGTFDESKGVSVGVAITFPAPFDTTRWSGDIDFDNLWIYGVPFTSQLIDGVSDIHGIPTSFHLENNYPNPFNPTTTIGYQVSRSSRVSLRIFDILGRELMTLVDGMHKPGSYKVTFDASHLSSGIYFDRLTSGNACETKTLVLLK